MYDQHQKLKKILEKCVINFNGLFFTNITFPQILKKITSWLKVNKANVYKNSL